MLRPARAGLQQRPPKQMDGDPQFKHRRLQFARQLAQQRIASAVPKADVIVTNPEHISVALQWDQATMNAPVVVAMGADQLAMRIRQIASKASCKLARPQSCLVIRNHAW